MSMADRDRSSGFVYPKRRTNDEFTRLNSPSKPMMDSGSIERSKNSSSSVSGCGTCGGLATSTHSFRPRHYRFAHQRRRTASVDSVPMSTDRPLLSKVPGGSVVVARHDPHRLENQMFVTPASFARFGHRLTHDAAERLARN